MTVWINGEAREIVVGTSVQQLLESLGIPAASVVVERNGEVLERVAFHEGALQPSDRLEVVRFVGGG